MDLSRSISFIDEHGSQIDRDCVHWIVDGVKPASVLVAGITNLQNEDGGFPYGSVHGRPSTIGDTLNALWKLERLGASGSAAFLRALDYLAATQKTDGGWDEDHFIEQYDPPPWRQPGKLPARLYLSAYSIFRLALADRGTVSSLRDGSRFLLQHQSESGFFPGFPHSTWIAASSLLLVDDQYTEPAECALQALAQRPLVEWVDSQICWALNCFRSAGVERSHTLVVRLLTELPKRQQSNGSWTSEDGKSHDVDATIDAIRILHD